ncbi:MAG: uroporphyrinogen-III synthase [Bacteroidia bacterium]
MRVTKPVRSILISQPAPVEGGNPYAELINKWKIRIDFRKFIQVEGLSLNDFRKLGHNPLDFTAIIFTSKVAVDHFFRLLGEMRAEMPPETKYFCVSESTSKYLQKYIVIRKRKLFVGERKDMDLMPYILKHKKEKYFFPCSNVSRRELAKAMEEKSVSVVESAIYKTVHSDLSDLEDIYYDMICFFSPTGIESLFSNFPNFKQNDTRIAVFGSSTAQEAVARGLHVDVEAPKDHTPSMTSAIEYYLREIGQKES